MTFIKPFKPYQLTLRKKYGNPKMVIAVSGLSGVGKTTIAKGIAKRFKLRYFSAGELFRSEARRRGLSLEEFLGKLKEIEKKEKVNFDEYFDRKMLDLIYRGKVVVEGRLAGVLAGETAITRIWVHCPSGFVAQRVAERERVTAENAENGLRQRNKRDISRYWKKYKTNFASEKFYNVFLDNTQPIDESVNEACYKIERAINGRNKLSIAISGKVGSGKSTIARKVAKALGYRCVSAGSIFRGLSKDMGLSLTELLELCKKRKSIHYEIDKRMMRSVKKGKCIAEGKLIVWLSDAILKVFLTASQKERARRIAKREGMPFSEAFRAVSHRDEKEEESFKAAYPRLDYSKPRCHLFIDTTEMGINQVVEKILKYAK